MDILYKSPVVFDQEAHTYELNGKFLSGVTAIVAWLFPDTYDAIPDHVLQRAAERGHAIHEAIELFEGMGIDVDDIPELIDYKNVKQAQGFEVIKTEYLVSDNSDFASSIDLVFSDFELCDIKSTSAVHHNNLSAQLSIYAYLFELANPQYIVPRLSCIWLPKKSYGEARYVPVKRIPAEDCKRIMQAYLNGEEPYQFWHLFGLETPQNTSEKETSLATKVSESILAMVSDVMTRYKQAEAEYKQMKAAMEKLMVENGVSKWENDYFKASRSADTESTRFDEKSFKEDNPELYAKYLKTVKRKGSFTINPK